MFGSIADLQEISILRIFLIDSAITMSTTNLKTNASIQDTIMPKYRIVGDIHGMYEVLEKALTSKYPYSKDPYTQLIQLGDFGAGFGNEPFEEDWFHNPSLTIIRGNHDSPDLFKLHRPPFILNWEIRGDCLFICGAESIDRYRRIEGVDWWPNEELSYDQWQHLFDALETFYSTKGKVINYVFSHDAPLEYVKENLGLDIDLPSRTQNNLQFFIDYLIDNGLPKPKKWFHGHYHRSKISTWKNIEFYSVDINEVLDIELDTSCTRNNRS
jgi:hypothetical protein